MTLPNCDMIVHQSKQKNLTKRKDTTEYLKLHGSVRNSSERFVFSPDDYVETITTSDFRFQSLAMDMHSEHFIFVGSNFDEFNIDYYMRIYENSGYASSRGKLFFITSKAGLLLKKKIEKLQGVLIEWTTQEFLEFISKLQRDKISSNEYDLQKELSSLSFNNIRIIKERFPDLQNYQSRLYFGDESKFEDIYTEWDFIDNHLIKTFLDFIDSAENDNYAIFSIVGKAYIGKSTFLKRIAVEISNKQYDTFIYSGRYFNIYPFIQYIKRSQNIRFALLMDNAGYNYIAIKQLVGMVPKDKQLIVITGSRPYFHFRYRYILNSVDI